MARLPTVGGDYGNWGTVLNEYLETAHNADGTLKLDVQTIADLKAIDVATLTDKQQALVAGYSAPGDGGGGVFYYDAVEVAADNGGTVIAPTAGAGRWLRAYSGAVNVKWFGAKGDGATDDSAVLQATINATEKVFIPSGIFYFTAKISLRSGTALVGEAGSTLKYGGAGSSSLSVAPFELREAGIIAAPTTFSTRVSMRGITLECVNQYQIAILAVNIRDIAVEECRFIKCGGLRVCHERQLNGSYVITNAGSSGDPAIEAGFSSTDLNDLNEDVIFRNNHVDGTAYKVFAVRLDFVRRFVVANNFCKYAAISWWGGSARNDANGYGGLKTFQRRTTQGTIVGNYVSWANGGIYGNNGSQITIAGNTCENIVDTGIDLEGCIACTVTGNTVRYAGNFCASVFYASLGNVFDGNVFIQGAAAAALNTAAGTADFSPNLGKTLFRGLSALSETPLNTVSLRGNEFIWEGVGFGAIVIDSRCEAEITGNTMRNVAVDTRPQAPSTSVRFSGNTLYFTSVPVANACYVALGSNQDPSTEVIASDNVFRVTNELASTVALLVQAKAFNGLVLCRIERNTVQSTVSTKPICYGDVRNRTGSPPKMSFFIANNMLRSGAIKNIGIISLTADGGYAPNVTDSGNYTSALAALAVDTTPDTSTHGTLVFGLSVS